MKLEEILNKKRNLFSGKIISLEEKRRLKEKFKSIFFINDILDLMAEYQLSEECFSINEKEDLSELGVEMQWFSTNEMIEEAYNAYPGICAYKKGYLPLGKCLEGSGDPYFIKKTEKKYNIYRIPHDSVINENLIEDEIELVCTLSLLLQRFE